jgi:dihydropyrimidinase
MSPPLRPEAHREVLWDALRDGVIQVVGTDHCPFNLRGQKDLGRGDFTKIPNGVAGIEDRLRLLYTYGVAQGRLSVHQFVEATATAPAKVFGLYPRKGVLAVGSDADIAVWDPASEGVLSASTQHQNCDTNVYEGFRVLGKPRVVIQRGQIAVEDDQVKVQRGDGEYLYRNIGSFI